MAFPKLAVSTILVILLAGTLTYVLLAPYYAPDGLSASVPIAGPDSQHSSKPASEDNDHHDDDDDDDDDTDESTTSCDPSLLPIPLPDDQDNYPPLNITIHDPSLPILPYDHLPPPHALSDAPAAIPLLLSLTRDTVWTAVANISLQADTFEPEGLLRLGPDRYILSCGEYTSRTQKFPPENPIQDGTDRTSGSGFAHLMVFAADGTRIADASISLADKIEYHNGGIDYDGKEIWGALSQYRPNTTATIYAADPATLRPRAVIHHPSDHLGAVAVEPVKDDHEDDDDDDDDDDKKKSRRHGGHRRRITSLNWGGRTATTFKLPPPSSSSSSSSSCIVPHNPPTTKNPSHFVDYQDCKYMGAWDGGRRLMLCSGVAKLKDDDYNLGGLALVDVDTMLPVAEIPITLQSDKGVRMTQNPVDFSVEDGKLRLYWAPDQHDSTLYIYEAQL